MRINKILFITESPFSFDLNGAASFSSGHLAGLLFAFPQSDILILNLTETSPIKTEQLNSYLEEAGFTGNINVHIIPSKILAFRVLKFKSVIKFPFANFIYKSNALFANINQEIIEEVNNVISSFNPDLIWAEHIFPALLITQKRANAKILYSQHDFLFRVLNARNKFSLRNFLRVRMLKNIESELLNRFDFFVNGSETERKYALHQNADLKSFTFPAAYPKRQNTSTKNAEALKNRIVHIGSYSATANRIGLAGFLKHIYPQLKKEVKNLELILIGDKISFEETEFNWVYEDPQIKITGHIENLNTVLQPYDIHVLPYNGKTGTRTRLINTLRFHGCVVMFEKSLLDFPEFKRETDLLSAHNYEEFTSQVLRLLNDPKLRIKIADNAFIKLNEHFTFQHLSEKIKHLLAA